MLRNAGTAVRILIAYDELDRPPHKLSVNQKPEAVAPEGTQASPEVNPAGIPPRATAASRLSILKWLAQFGPTLFWIFVAALAFHVAYAASRTSLLVVVYLFALLQLARIGGWRNAYYSGLAVGFLIAAVRLAFFWRIFSAGSVALWYVYAFWIGIFVAVAGAWLRRWTVRTEAGAMKAPAGWTWLLIPFLWTGLEYFRSELYYLRFSWLSPGYAFADAPWQMPLRQVGAYGLCFLLMAIACAAALFWQRSRLCALAMLVAGTGCLRLWGGAPDQGATHPGKTVRIAGVQMEQPTEPEVMNRLTALLRKQPDTELIVLSEYTFNEPIPAKVKDWCRKNGRYLIVGGTEPAPGSNYSNTAFVIGPDGDIVFRQVKSVPIQFFKDGLPAREQALWESPWGKLGLCICYDLSYRRVTDRLVGLGAQGVIVPTMDVMDWGQTQHELHARVAPTRAAEYGIPIFRLASSGISQWVSPSGGVLGTAPCPGDGAVLAGVLELGEAGRLPLDHWLAPVAVGVSGVMILWLLLWRGWGKGSGRAGFQPGARIGGD
ncbi:Apolipoprotein N-acyltransferase-like protein [Verrucomicrobia bacterium]|nr:Apolipoprotein N-acyltransferase-like protein [Verrucomicrobiota bacterium]